MPAATIRPIVLCLFRRDRRILVAYATDAATGERYARPLGGGIEFGEGSLDALRREMREALGAEIASPRLVGTLENRFTLERQPRHEVAFVYDADFVDHRFYEAATLPLLDEGWDGPAEWVAPDALRAGNLALYPDGVQAFLDAPRPSPVPAPRGQRLDMVTLVVRDYDEAIAFFTGVVGFELVENTRMSESKRWVRLRPRGSEDAAILLARAATPEQEACVGRQTAGRVGFFLHTDDFWRDYRALSAHAVRFRGAPREEPYGTVAVFEDLYGNAWDLIEPRR